jgi:hypothetical protein
MSIMSKRRGAASTAIRRRYGYEEGAAVEKHTARRTDRKPLCLRSLLGSGDQEEGNAEGENESKWEKAL